MRRLLVLLLALVFAQAVSAATIINTLPYNLQNGTTADASQVMGNFNQVVANVNANGAGRNANADITSLSALSNGSNSAPSIAFSGGTTSGIYYTGTQLCLVVANGSPFCTDTSGDISAPGTATIGTMNATTESVSGTSTVGTMNATNFQQSGTAAYLVPSGAVVAFYLSSCPTGWVAANGTAVAIDLRGNFVRGLDSGAGVDPGRGLGTFQAEQLHSFTGSFTGNIGGSSGGGTPFAASNASSNYTLNISNFSGANFGSETRPRNVALLYCYHP